ncbi:MAG: methylated-DNA--[protein]-cysteine S-methyltransferase [Gemmatimonadales bacterium]
MNQATRDLAGRFELELADARATAVALRVLDTPVGPLVAAAVDQGLVLLEFGNEQRIDRQLSLITRDFGPARLDDHPILSAAERELAEYFAGSRKQFDIPLETRGTPFQERVWAELMTIPYGTTTAYADIAERLELPNGQRAVGLANGQNRISIIIPCHRVIERSGGLRGYGGGLDRKRFLLELEGRHSDPLADTPLGKQAGRLS